MKRHVCVFSSTCCLPHSRLRPEKQQECWSVNVQHSKTRKKTCPQSLMKIRLRQHLHIKIYHVTHERILMFLMLPTADMCFDKRFSRSTDQKLLTPHIFFFNWGESSKVLCGALWLRVGSRESSRAVDGPKLKYVQLKFKLNNGKWPCTCRWRWTCLHACRSFIEDKKLRLTRSCWIWSRMFSIMRAGPAKASWSNRSEISMRCSSAWLSCWMYLWIKKAS